MLVGIGEKELTAALWAYSDKSALKPLVLLPQMLRRMYNH